MRTPFRFRSPVSIRFGAFLIASALFISARASAQLMVLPDVIASYAAWPATREAAPDDPAMEPVVSLASLVIALGDGLGSGAITLDSRTALSLQLHLTELIDLPVLARSEAGRRAAELTDILESRQLITLVSLSQKRNYAGRADLLGAGAATANPFYNPALLPGYAARFILAHIDATLRPAE